MIPKITLAIALMGAFFSGLQAQLPVAAIKPANSFNLLNELRNTDTLPPGRKLKNPVDSQTIKDLLKRPSGLLSKLGSDVKAQQEKAARMLEIQKQLSSVRSLYSNPITFSEGKAAFRMASTASYIQPGSNAYFGNIVVNSNWLFAGVPVSVSVDNQSLNDNRSDNFSNFSFHFDRDTYLNSLKKKLKGDFNPEQFLDNKQNPVEQLKAKAEELLSREMDGLNKQYGEGLAGQLGNIGNVKDLMEQNMTSIRERVMNSEYVNSIRKKEEQLTALQFNKNSGQSVDQHLLDSLQSEVSSMKGATELLSRVEEHKSKWASSGLLSKVKQMDLLKKAELEKIASDPATTLKRVKQEMNLTGLQRFFLKLNHLNIGQNALTESPLTVNHLLNKGINTSFFNNNKLFNLGFGKTSNINSIRDLSFTDPLSALDGMMRSVRMGVGNTNGAHTHFSVSSYSQSFSNPYGFSDLNTFRNSLITTISNQFDIGARGVLRTEVSRSATTYREVAGADSGNNKSATQQIFSGNDFFNTMAFAVSYDDELEDHGIQYGVHVEKTANGYVNPGSAFLNAGGKEVGFTFRKTLFNRMFSAGIRSDLREYDYSEDGSSKWRNMYSVLDLRWRMKKGQSVAIRYAPNRMRRIEGKSSQVVTKADRLAVEGNFVRRIAGSYYRNTFTLAYQHNMYSLGADLIANKTFTVSGFQNYTLQKKLLFLNTTYNHISNKSNYVYFNSSFVGEAGVTYQLFKLLTASSALTYNSVSGWYRQAGIRQTLSNQLSERFNLNLFVDARKNISIYQPLLYGLFRADVSILYSIRK